MEYKHSTWLKSLPSASTETLNALAKHFVVGGTDELENPFVFYSTDVMKAGGLEALKILGESKDIINEMKKRLFAA